MGTNMAVSQNSYGVNVQNQFLYGFQLFWTGSSMNGTFKLQGSLQIPTTPAGSILWSDVVGSAEVITSGLTTYGNANYLWSYGPDAYGALQLVRIVWTPSSGTGTLTNAICSIKGS